MSAAKEICKVIRDAKKRGWVDISHTRKNPHHLLEYLDGTRITAPLSPSDYRAVRNLRADLRRVEKGVDQRQQ